MSGTSITNFTICRICAGVGGYPEERSKYPQVCRCHGTEGPRWPDHDFNEYLALCWCCGLELIDSGSRWSMFYCEDCKKRASAFNASVGRMVLYQGRHSLMHGVGLAGRDIDRPGAIEAFRQAISDFSRGIIDFCEAMDAWRPHRLQEVLGAVGWEVSGDEDPPQVSLVEYLRATRNLDWHPVYGKQAAFRAMVGFLAYVAPGEVV